MLRDLLSGQVHENGMCGESLLLAVPTCIVVERKESRVAGRGIKEQQTLTPFFFASSLVVPSPDPCYLFLS